MLVEGEHRELAWHQATKEQAEDSSYGSCSLPGPEMEGKEGCSRPRGSCGLPLIAASAETRGLFSSSLQLTWVSVSRE